MSITVLCPKGHRLVAKEECAGKTGRCPTCKATVSIPLPHTGYLSETAILSILGSPEPQKKNIADDFNEFANMGGLATAVPRTEKKYESSTVKPCPSCDREIDSGYHICPHCQTYISSLSDF